MSSISYSFIPGEIVAPGTTLELRAPRDVHPESAGDGIRLIQAGNHLPANVAVKGNVIEVPTDSLAPASYRISVSKLPGSDGQPLMGPIEVSFVVGGLKGTIPNGFRAIHAVYLAVGDLSTTRLRPGESAPDGTTYVEIVKAVNVETRKSLHLSFDDQGNQIDGPRLLAQVHDRRFAKFGHLRESLWNHLQNCGDTDAVPVVVWPKIDTKDINYKKPNDHYITTPLPEERECLKVIRGQRTQIVDTLNQLGATVEKGEDNVPFVAASLTAGGVGRLAKSEEVGLVSFDDRNVLLDLADSIAIARSALPHGRGIVGTGVRVAVFERGPDDTTNLVIAGRFDETAGAPTSDHARLVSAVIKNVQPNGPHGHAPDCELYSANSYDNAALDWAIADGRECTVINQSFHRPSERTTPTLSSDDIRKDWIAINHPYPTIVQASSNKQADDPQSGAYVVHKGFNTLSIGNHDDDAAAMAPSSIWRNPSSPHSDRELPELCANGTGVTAVGLTKSGTSFSSPAVAGVVALLQHADDILKSWPEGCRAILLASAGRNVSDSTWWNDVVNGLDARDGAGALDADAAVKIAEQRKTSGEAASICGWDVGTLTTADFDENNRTTFHYSVQVPDGGGLLKAALAWDSKVTTSGGGPTGSVLTVDFDLFVLDSNGNVAAHSSSFDNSYEIAEFQATANQTYEIYIDRWSGTDDIWYGLAWTVFKDGESLAP